MVLFSAVLCAAIAMAMCAATTADGEFSHTRYTKSHHQRVIFKANVSVWVGKEVAKRDYFANQQDRPLQMEEDEEFAFEEDEEEEADMELFGKGVTYVRWGRSVCPKGVELVYAGRAGGSHYSHSGGGSNYQCLTLKPANFNFGPGTVAASYIYGAEYEVYGNVPKDKLSLHDHDVPCAVCYVSSRTAKIMIPGTYICPSKWKTEYYGYLMAERANHHRSTFECMDKDAKPAYGGHVNRNGALFYFVEPRCGALPCPPYDQQKEVTCAVCTR